MIKIEEIVFWILIALIVGLAVWKLFGSPSDTASLIALALFVASSELLIWRFMFNVDKRTAIGFVKLRGDIDNRFNRVDNKLNNLVSRGR